MAVEVQQDNAAAILGTLSYIISIVLSLCLLVFVTVLFLFFIVAFIFLIINLLLFIVIFRGLDIPMWFILCIIIKINRLIQ